MALTSPVFSLPLPDGVLPNTPAPSPDGTFLGPNVGAQLLSGMNYQAPQTPSRPLGPQGQFVEQDPRHMGVAGVARDILGTIGDVFLKKLGVGAMYAPAQQRRRLAEANQDFQTNPMDAISNVRALNPELADQEQGVVQSNDNRLASLAQTASNNAAIRAQAQQRIDDYHQVQLDKVINGQSGLIGSIKDGNGYEMKRDAWNGFLDRKGVDANDLRRLPDKYDPNDVAGALSATMSDRQSQALDYKGRQVATGEKNADTASRREGTYQEATDNTNNHQIRSDANGAVNAGAHAADVTNKGNHYTALEGEADARLKAAAANAKAKADAKAGKAAPVDLKAKYGLK